MTTVLEYLVIAAAIGAVVFVVAVVVFGRGEQMAPLSPRTSPAQLPEAGISGDDVRSIRFSLAVRGYRMSDVDWTLDRLSDELDRLRRDNARLRGEPDPVPARPDILGPGEEQIDGPPPETTTPSWVAGPGPDPSWTQPGGPAGPDGADSGVAAPAPVPALAGVPHTPSTFSPEGSASGPGSISTHPDHAGSRPPWTTSTSPNRAPHDPRDQDRP